MTSTVLAQRLVRVICPHCRVGICDVMQLSDEFRRSIMKNEDAGILTTIARREGMTTLREDGCVKIANGATTADEVLRVTQEI